MNSSNWVEADLSFETGEHGNMQIHLYPHFFHNLSIVLESDSRARGRSSFEAVGDIGGQSFVAVGYYENEYVRTADGWRFLLHREVPFFFVKQSEGWAGPKPAIMREWLKNRPS